MELSRYQMRCCLVYLIVMSVEVTFSISRRQDLGQPHPGGLTEQSNADNLTNTSNSLHSLDRVLRDAEVTTGPHSETVSDSSPPTTSLAHLTTSQGVTNETTHATKLLEPKSTFSSPITALLSSNLINSTVSSGSTIIKAITSKVSTASGTTGSHISDVTTSSLSSMEVEESSVEQDDKNSTTSAYEHSLGATNASLSSTERVTQQMETTTNLPEELTTTFVPPVLLGDSCSTAQDCSEVDHAHCSGSICTCQSGFYSLNNTYCTEVPRQPIILPEYTANETTVTISLIQSRHTTYINSSYFVLLDGIFYGLYVPSPSRNQSTQVTVAQLHSGFGYNISVMTTVRSHHNDRFNSSATHILVYTVPPKPQLKPVQSGFTDGGAREVLLWSLPPNSTAQRFIMEYRDKTIKINGANRSYVFEDIPRGVLYNVSLASKSGQWVSEYAFEAFVSAHPAPRIIPSSLTSSEHELSFNLSSNLPDNTVLVVYYCQQVLLSKDFCTRQVKNTASIHLRNLDPAFFYRTAIHYQTTISNVEATSNSSTFTAWTKPTPPEVIQNFTETADSVTLTIDSHGTSGNENYTVTFCSGVDTPHCRTREYTTRSVVLSDLQPSTAYRVNLTAHVSTVTSNPTSLRIYTMPSPLLEAEISSVTTYSISMEVQKGFGNVTQFRVMIRDSSARIVMDFDAKYLSEPMIVSVDDASLILPGTFYNISIAPVMVFDTGVTRTGAALTRLTYTKPSTPVLVHKSVMNTTATIVWSQTNVIEFDLTLRRPHDTESKRYPNPNRLPNVTVVYRKLTPGTPYSLSIAARISRDNLTVRTSDPLVVNFTTLESSPSEPVGAAVTAVNSSSVNVTWGHPVDRNGILIGYRVTYGQLQVYTLAWLTRVIRTNVTTYVVITDLMPGGCYHFTVRAVNSAGMSPPTPTMPKKLTGDVPGVVQNVSVNVTSREMQLVWSIPLVSNGVIERYVVRNNGTSMLDTCNEKAAVIHLRNHCLRYPCSGSNNNVEGNSKEITATSRDHCHMTLADCQTSAISTVIRELLPYTAYTYTVSACTHIGCGAVYSGSITTLQEAPSAVVSLTARATSSTSLTVTWQPPTHPNGIITQYKVRYATPKDGNTTISNITVTSYVLSPLRKWTTYQLTVIACTIECGPPVNMTQTTLEDTPGAPILVTTTALNASSVMLSWLPPVEPNGVITAYTIACFNAKTKIPCGTVKVSPRLRTRIITGLKYWTLYTFKVAGSTSQGQGSWVERQVRTLQHAPSTVVSLKAHATSSTSLTVTWQPPTHPNGVITQYKVRYATPKDGNTTISNITMTSYVLSPLRKWTTYQLTVIACTIECGPPVNMTQTTLEDTPGAPILVTTTALNASSVTLSWLPPVEPNGVITAYTIACIDTKTKIPCGTVQVSPRLRTRIITGLKYWTMYTFKVAGRTSQGQGSWVERQVRTLQHAPVFLSNASIMASKSSSNEKQQLTWFIPIDLLYDETYGIPTHWGIIVTEQSFISDANEIPHIVSLRVMLSKYQRWSDYYNEGVQQPFRATPDDWVPIDGYKRNRPARDVGTSVKFIAGFQGSCTGFCNGKLKPDTIYRIRAFVCNVGGCGQTVYSEPQRSEAESTTGSMVGAAVGAVIAFILIVSIIAISMRHFNYGPWKVKRTAFVSHRLSQFSTISQTKSSTTEVPGSKFKNVKLVDFEDHVTHMASDSNLKFAEEYRQLRMNSPKHSVDASLLEVNRPKNRYSNILAFDHSRVRLMPFDDDDGSDYINANYIPGYSSQREYIACQGPLPSTIDDFWRMIWEQKVSIIVMVTQLVERGKEKCAQYWPGETEECVFYGDLVVTMTSETVLCDYNVRVLDVQLGESLRTVKQYHFLKWPDFNCPDTPAQLTNFCTAIRNDISPTMAGPLIVHCSAGVGRTGTFIAVDHLRQLIHEKDEVSIQAVVQEMRNHRNHMVQTENQYIYIHECILAEYKEMLLNQHQHINLAFEKKEDHEDGDDTTPV